MPLSEAREEYKNLWRGARIALRVLSIVENHNVTELSFDSNQLTTGIYYMIFSQPCEEYNHFAAIMKRPGFHHLYLSFLVGYNGIYDWGGFKSGYFSHAVSLAKELTYIHLTVTVEGGDSANDPVVPLKEILPVQEWPSLHHLGLSYFSVSTSELINLLSLVPTSLRSIELGFLKFPNDARRWSELLERIRDELDWKKREETMRPAVRILMEGFSRTPGRFVLLTDEVVNFLYGSGENPIEGMSTRNPKFGMGTSHDFLEAEYTRPSLSMKDLAQLGIFKY